MTVTKQDQNDEFLNAVSDSLDRSCDSLDGYTRSRLTSMRHEALASMGSNSHVRRWLQAAGSVAVAGICIVVLFTSGVFNLQTEVDGLDPVSNETLTDLDLLTAEEGLEFYENYEFYQWLAERDSSV